MSNAAAIKYEVGPDVLYQAVDSEAVLLSLTDQKYYGLNAMATHIWQLLLEYSGTDRVVDRICEEYEVEREQAAKDVESVAQGLVAAGLLKICAR